MKVHYEITKISDFWSLCAAVAALGNQMANSPAEKPTHISAVSRTNDTKAAKELKLRGWETYFEAESEAACLPLDWLTLDRFASLSLPLPNVWDAVVVIAVVVAASLARLDMQLG